VEETLIHSIASEANKKQRYSTQLKIVSLECNVSLPPKHAKAESEKRFSSRDSNATFDPDPSSILNLYRSLLHASTYASTVPDSLPGPSSSSVEPPPHAHCNHVRPRNPTTPQPKRQSSRPRPPQRSKPRHRQHRTRCRPRCSPRPSPLPAWGAQPSRLRRHRLDHPRPADRAGIALGRRPAQLGRANHSQQTASEPALPAARHLFVMNSNKSTRSRKRTEVYSGSLFNCSCFEESLERTQRAETRLKY
jgi:hypothetical protein